MQWTILGFGALGGVIACQLKHQGEDVQVILPRKFQSLATTTVNYHTLNSQTPTRIPISFHPPKTKIAQGGVIVTTKAYDVYPALQHWQPYLSPETPVILLHNGMGIDEKVQALLPTIPVITGVTEIGAMHREHCSFRLTGRGNTWLGYRGQHLLPKQITAMIAQLKRCLPQTYLTHFIHTRQWQKLAINAVINPLSAKYNVKNGALLTATHREEIMELCAELTTLFHALNLEGAPQESILEQVLGVLHHTQDNSSSMRQDILHKRPTEIDFLNGYMLAQAVAKRIDMPKHQAIYHFIKQLEETYES